MRKIARDRKNPHPVKRGHLTALFAMSLMLASGLVPQTLAAPKLSQSAMRQMQTLLHEKATRTPVQRKISSPLLYKLKQDRGNIMLRSLRARVEPRANGTTLVDMTARVTPALLAAIEQAGGTLLSIVASHQAIRARLPMSQIESLANRPEITFIRPAMRAVTFGQGAFTRALNGSEGDLAHQADVARETFGVDGTGIKIGVLSDSVDFLSRVQASGDLPDVTVLPGQSGITLPDAEGEGTAMLEIVHDLAPGAELFFATAFGSPAAFARNIRNLRFVANCDIIVDDVLYFDESPFQDGIIAQAVNEVTADGALFFSAAGNEGNANDGTSGVWEGDFVDAGPLALLSGGTVHDFGGGIPANPLTEDAPLAITLFWSDPLRGSDNDYDLFLLDANLTTVLAASTDIQDGNDDPFEMITDISRGIPCAASRTGLCAALQGERLVVLRKTGAAERFLHLNTNRGRLAIGTAGQTRGHNSAVDAISVAAVDVATAAGGVFIGGAANPVETFSSDGPRRVFYHPDGSPITPGDVSSTGGTVRQKPDLAAADGVRTATPGFRHFSGTSAAAPHAAAIAALVQAANPALTASEMRAVLNSTALDIEALGVDRDSGAGLIDAFAAVQAAREGIPQSSVCQACSEIAGLVAGSVQTGPGTTVTVRVEIRNAPQAVAEMAFDVTFDADFLQFVGFTPDSPASNQDFIVDLVDVFLVEPGRVRVEGSALENMVPAGTSGAVVDLHFDLLACQQNQEIPLTFEGLNGDVATWDTCAGCVTCSCQPDGDVNQDGHVTPADALLAFRHFLNLADPPLDACQRAHANVLDPLHSDITPSDTLCIFQKFLGLLSCLDHEALTSSITQGVTKWTGLSADDH